MGHLALPGVDIDVLVLDGGAHIVGAEQAAAIVVGIG